MATIEIRLFGGLALERDGQSLPRFPTRRVKDLLAYLIVNRQTPHSRERLAGLFWGDHEEAKARHCLNTALWRLNRVLGPPERGRAPLLLVDNLSLGFNSATDAWVDVEEFERCCQLAERVANVSAAQAGALYQQAVELYTADLLTDCHDDWCLFERERIQRLQVRALTRLLAYHAEQGNPDVAAEYGLRILARDGLREEVHRDLIEVFLAAGQSDRALQQYRSCEAILRQELGIAPMPETQALLARILAGMGAPAVMPVVTMTTHATACQLTSSDDLAAALARLRAALATFDVARNQLDAALTVVEALAGALSLAAVPSAAPRSIAALHD